MSQAFPAGVNSLKENEIPLDLSKTNVIPLNNQYKKSKQKLVFWGKFHTPKEISFAFNKLWWCGTIPRGGENKPGSSASSLLHGKTRTRKNWSCILGSLKTKGKSFLCINLEKHLT